MLSDCKILVTGGTGQAIRPTVDALAASNEVWCLGRFSDPAVKEQLEAQGVRTRIWTLGGESIDDLPDDFTHVLHAAPYRGQPGFDVAAQANATAAGTLMQHCRRARAFLFISTFAVYAKAEAPDHLVAESDPLGGNAPYAPSYPVGKAAAEGAVRALAHTLGLPATIARLNVCYGPTGWGGLPVEYFARVRAGEPIYQPTDGSEAWCSPISTDDVARFVPRLWDVASTTTTVVNLAGDEATTAREFTTYLAEQADLPVEFVVDERSRSSYASDNARRLELIGPCSVHWREGMLRAVEAHFPQGAEAAAAAGAQNIWGHS
jgi:nucleoside-diphosphate-sugar epimerase